MSKEPRTHDDGRNEKQRAQQAREMEMEHERSAQRDQRSRDVDEERNRQSQHRPGEGRLDNPNVKRQPREDDPNRLAGRPDDAKLRDDATPRQRIAYEKDEPGFVERMAEERQRPDFIETTLPEDPSDHYGQLTRDNVNPDIPSSKTREGWIADPHTLKMDQSQQGEQPPEREDQVEQWPQAQKLPASGEYQKGDDLQQQHEVDPNAPIPPKPREGSINEPPGSNVLPGMETGPNQPPEGWQPPTQPGGGGGGEGEVERLTLTDIDPDRIPVQPEEIAEIPLTVTGTGFSNDCVVLFDDEEVPTTFVSPTQLKASVPIAPAEGTYDVEVARGEELSDVLTFEIVPAEAGSGTQSAKREKQKPKPKKSEPPSKRAKKGKGKR
jgi:hypothetical protein